MKTDRKKKNKHRDEKIRNEKTSDEAENESELDEKEFSVGGWIVEKKSKTNKIAAAAFFLLLMGVTLGRFENYNLRVVR